MPVADLDEGLRSSRLQGLLLRVCLRPKILIGLLLGQRFLRGLLLRVFVFGGSFLLGILLRIVALGQRFLRGLLLRVCVFGGEGRRGEGRGGEGRGGEGRGGDSKQEKNYSSAKNYINQKTKKKQKAATEVISHRQHSLTTGDRSRRRRDRLEFWTYAKRCGLGLSTSYCPGLAAAEISARRSKQKRRGMWASVHFHRKTRALC